MTTELTMIDRMYGFVLSSKFIEHVNPVIKQFHHDRIVSLSLSNRGYITVTDFWNGIGDLIFSDYMFGVGLFNGKAKLMETKEKINAIKALDANLNHEHTKNLVPGYSPNQEIAEFLKRHNYIAIDFAPVKINANESTH